MSKGWYGHKQQHSMASKGVRSGNIKKFRANGTFVDDGNGNFDISEHLWGLERNGDDFRLRLGNWTTAGWHWSGDERDFAGYLIRIGGARGDLGKDFIEAMRDYGISFEDLKEIIIESAKDGSGVYMLTGDNVKWHFGQDGERESEIIQYDIGENYGLTDDELDRFTDWYWINGKSNSTSFGAFEESEYYKDLVDEITGAIERSDSWEDVLNQLSDARDIGEEASWEFSDNAVRDAVYEGFNEWDKTSRWDFDVESGLPDAEMVENMLKHFGRVETMKKIQKNYWDVETIDEAKRIVKKYEEDAIRKGRRPIEEGQKRLKDFESNGLKMPTSKADARQQAIDWQHWMSNQNLSMGEMIEYQNHFEKAGKKYGLLREFRENGII